MYGFFDYFDPEKIEQPYTAAGEELEDYLRLLDMILEEYLRFKGMDSKSRLFSRGLVITESEMAGYFEMPPFYRERDIWDPEKSGKQKIEKTRQKDCGAGSGNPEGSGSSPDRVPERNFQSQPD